MNSRTVEDDGQQTGDLRIRLLGGVSAHRIDDDQAPLDVGPAKSQAILAVLALSVGVAVPVTRIIEVVWGDDPPRTADKTLQSYVTRLRKALGPHSIGRPGAAYRLDLDPAVVDVTRFRSRLDAGDIPGALGEWGGAPLAGLEVAGLAASVDGLVEQWLGAVESDLERSIESEPSAAVGALTELTADYPFREGLWALLMTALYRSDRQAEALAAYRSARHHLVEELGVEPGPRLQELEAQVLGQDEVLHATRTADAAEDRPSGTVTFGFYDVDREAALWAERRGDMAAAMTRFDDLVQHTVSVNDGYLFAADGQARGVAFHRAADGLRWAADLQRAVAAETWPACIPLQVRIGLHTGEPEERRNGYFGPPVNVATGLVAVGNGGQTLLSGVTAALSAGVGQGDGIGGLQDLGTFRLDGVMVDQPVLQLGNERFPPLRTADGRRGNLTNQTGRLIGRDEALRSVEAAIGPASIVTLVGPGGIGKTRLATAAAHRWAAENLGDVWFIEFASIASSQDVARAVAGTLQVREGSGISVIDSVVSYLTQHPALVVLDNCEHVIDGVAEIAEAIAGGCSDTSVLATSREGLGLQGERLVVVAPLNPADEGVELFNERAGAASHMFDAEAHRGEVEEICRRLDGVPLAIELAAARTTSLAPADLVDRLDDRLRLLTGGRRTTVERHRTLRATIQWSYDLLSEPEQLLFQRLSIFAGPFDLRAAETVGAEASLLGCETGPGTSRSMACHDVDELLGGLVDQSMVIVESGPFGRRFRMLETMRQFGAEHLSVIGQTDPVAARHTWWCLEQVNAIHELLSGQREIEGVARLDELWANLRAAVDWACATGDGVLAASLVLPVGAELSLRNNTEIGDWVDRILNVLDPVEEEDLLACCLSLAALRYMLNRDATGYNRLVDVVGEPDHPLTRHARALVEDIDEELLVTGIEARQAYRQRGYTTMAAMVEISSSIGPLLALGRFDEHDALAADTLPRFRREGPPTLLHWLLFCSGYSRLFQGRHEEAERFLEEASKIDVPDRTMSLNAPIEARAALRRGQPMRAVSILRSHLDELLETDNLMVGSLACAEYVNVLVGMDRLKEAAHLVGFLTTSGDFTELASRTYVGESIDRLNQSPEVSEQDLAFGLNFSPREALTYMNKTLAAIEAEHRSHRVSAADASS